ncbi:hypothetical protein DL96DRAFT_1578917 [Flagelloscypha sp. PMI_526]|nr:hypothetical protein DL96DRAFT_1578917 [Flagelloscypha sp. PMI_526]
MLRRILSSDSSKARSPTQAMHTTTYPSPPVTSLVLPAEVWFQITSFLDDQDLRNFMCLNSLFLNAGLNAKYRRILMFSDNITSEPIELFHKITTQLRTSPHISARVRHIRAEGDLFERLAPPPEPTKLSKIASMFQAKKPPNWPEVVRKSFSGCMNIERLDLVFNGWKPGMPITIAEPAESIYMMGPMVDTLLDALTTSFRANLRELRIGLDNRHRVRHVLKSRGLQFPKLEFLSLQLYHSRRHVILRQPWDEVFTDFLAQFSQTLGVLRLRISGPTYSPLDTLLGNLPVFPVLHTLELRSHTSYLRSSGVQHLNQFLERTPTLKHLSILGSCFHSHADLGQDVIVLPDHFRPESFTTSEEILRTHGANITASLEASPPNTLGIQIDIDNGSRPTLFKRSLSEIHRAFTKHVTTLRIYIVSLSVNVAALAIGDLFPSLVNLVIECEYILIPRIGGHHGSSDPVRCLTDKVWVHLLSAASEKPAFTNHPLKTIDILRRQSESIADHDGRVLFCDCAEIRFWGVLRVFQHYFPRAEWFGGGDEVYHSSRVMERLSIVRPSDVELCGECASRDVRTNLSRIFATRPGGPFLRW